jgi:LPS-assembly protein
VSVTPKIGYHMTRYSMTRNYGNDTSLSRNVPILSLDSSVTLERNMTWEGKDLVQTLEPRLYYLYVPYRDQSQFPVFDSGLADFNFAQIFAENIYSGNDRIADANQLTATLTSRIIDPQTGAQAMQAAIGQRYYFRNQSVTLNELNQPAAMPVEVPRTGSKADILAAFTGNILPRTYLDSGWEYNPRDKQTQRFTIGGRYQPEALKVANIGYRFKRDSVPGANDGLRDFDISGQWPLHGRWYGLGRYNYSLHDRNLVESLGGVEYDGGCWVGRFVVQRFATTTLSHTTTLFFQLELNGFSRLGSDPGDVLRRSIGGYGRVNAARDAPLFGVE